MAPAATSKKRRGRRNFAIAFAILAGLGLAVFGYWYFYMRGIVSTDDARIEADLVDMAPEIGGTLTEVTVRAGDSVQKHQLLFTIDPTLPRAALARAEAEQQAAEAALAQAQAVLAKARHGPRAEQIRVAKDTLQRASVQTHLAATELARTRKLCQSKALPEKSLDQAQARWESAVHEEQAARDRLRMLEQGTRREDLAAAEANVRLAQARAAAAKAAVEQARATLARTKVYAPFDGVVVRLWRHPGAMLAPGTPVITLMNPATLHVSANVEEKDLADVANGAPVDIEVDAFPSHPLHGHVSQILRATNSKFSLIPAEGVSGTFIKVTQRINLRIDFDDPPALALSPGLSVEVRIHRGNTPARHHEPAPRAQRRLTPQPLSDSRNQETDNHHESRSGLRPRLPESPKEKMRSRASPRNPTP